jgi:hypothetical protein
LFFDASIATNSGDWAVPLVSGCYKKSNWLSNISCCQGTIGRYGQAYLMKSICPVKHAKCSPPSDIAVEWDLEGVQDVALNLKLIENVNLLT